MLNIFRWIWSAFKWLLSATIVVVAVIIASALCGLAEEEEIELDKTEGMVETVGEFEVDRRGTIRYRIFRHPEQEPNAKTKLLLIRAVAGTERYMASAFPAKTVALIFDDTDISVDHVGHLRVLPGAGFFAPISHNLSAQWIQMEVRPHQERDTDSLQAILAHYYWHHQLDDVSGFWLDEGAAHFLEHELGGADWVKKSSEATKRCLTGARRSRFCRDDEVISRYSAAGVFIEAEEILGLVRFRRAFREIWRASKDNPLGAADVHDALCAHAGKGKCSLITAVFEEYGFNP